MYKKLWLLGSVLVVSSTLFAQVKPMAEGVPYGSMWVGAEISTFNPDYGCMNSSPFSCWNHQLMGISPYIDVKTMLSARVRMEAQGRFLHWHGPGSLTETSYLAGPIVRLWQYRQLTLSGKLLVGRTKLAIAKPAVGSGSYLAYAPGALVDYRVWRRMSARLDFENQIWANFKGVKTRTTDGTGALTPTGLSFGLSYALR
jgi:hypothetical protein